MRLRIMTFNVRGSFHEDGENAWDKRRDLNIATILKYEPDVIGFQEAQRGNLEDYAASLADYETEPGPVSIRQAENYHRVPIYWKHARFERLDSGGFYLSETPAEWSLSWGSTLPRAATWVRLRVPESSSEIVILNTHFPHEPESHTARTESARLVIQQLAQTAGAEVPQIVMADFNALPGSEAYQVFLDSGYVDTFTAAGHTAAVNTYHGFQGHRFPQRGLRIDWIMTRRFAARRCDIITDESPPLYPSDHYPVLAEVELI